MINKPDSWTMIVPNDVIVIRKRYGGRPFGMRISGIDPFRRNGTGYAFVTGERLTAAGEPSRRAGNVDGIRHSARLRRELIHLADVQDWRRPT